MRKKNGLKNSDIPKRLMVIRLLRGLSRKDVADYLGITLQSVCFMETGKMGVTLENAIKLSELYEMTLDDLFKKPLEVKL